ncbi:hypothetical protein LXA43DRAFT_152362 [Ganoderma leucocontextum]|nr:hypothetical protein LXA43DRAFT_152362 [Ganoderma leucocontextum]
MMQSPRSFDTPSPPSPVSTLRISIPDVLPQDISRRIAELDIGAKNKIVDAISQERFEFKNLWNRSLPINRLPNELLVQIFVSGVHSELFDSDSDLWVAWRRGPPPSFSKIMGTCRLWRDIILGTPALWCTVNLEKNPKWTEVCLARSVAAPLEVWAQVPFPCCPARFRAAYPVVHRIRSLYLGVSTQFGDPVRDLTLPLLFGDGMPVLEELDLAITHGMYRLPIGVDLTSRRFPRLRSLTLASMVAPQDTPLYAQLRTLSLTTCSHHLSFDRFLDTLALCTRLEELCLKDTLHHLSGDWMQGDPGPGQPLVSLPRLDRLALSNHGCACTSRFLARLHIQPSVRLELSADIDAASPDGSRSIAAMLPPSHALGTLEPLATVSDVHMRMASDPGSKSVWIHTGPSTPGETGSTTSTSLRMGLAPRGPHNDPHAPCEWLRPRRPSGAPLSGPGDVPLRHQRHRPPRCGGGLGGRLPGLPPPGAAVHQRGVLDECMSRWDGERHSRAARGVHRGADSPGRLGPWLCQ